MTTWIVFLSLAMMSLLCCFPTASASQGRSFAVVETLEAEEAKLNNVELLNTHNGYNGVAYGDFRGIGSHMAWELQVPTSGNYKISIRYASADSRPIDLLVDDVKQGTFAITETSRWNIWYTETVTVFLNQGTRELKLLASESKGPNVDRMMLELSDGSIGGTDSNNNQIYEAEDARVNYVQILSRHDGYQGDGYADFSGQGAYVEWTVDVPASGTYTISTRYASGNSRPLDVIVDGQKVDGLAIAGTGGWTSWFTEDAEVFMTQGTHTVTLLASSSTGPNIDYISVKSSEILEVPLTAPPTPAPVSLPTVNTPTASLGTVFYQPEDAESNRVTIDDNNDGYEGNNGFADYLGNGSYLKWIVQAPVSGTYEVACRYSARVARPAFLVVDAQEIDEFAFAKTNSWSSWAIETKEVYLSAGSHTIMILADQSAGPNLDWMSLRPKNASPPGTPGPTPGPTPQPTRPPTKGPTRMPTKAPTPKPTTYGFTKYQPEDAKENNVDIEFEESNYEDDNGYADFQGTGSYLLWSVTVPISTYYEVAVRYSSKNSRPLDLMIDGTFADEFTMPKTNSWDVWSVESKQVYLTAGDHGLMILAVTSTGPNIDWMSVRALTSMPTGMPPPPPPLTPQPTPPPTRPPTKGPTRPPTRAPTPPPTKAPTPPPTNAPVNVGQPTNLPPSNFATITVLSSGQRLEKGEFVSSPSGAYRAGVTNSGNFVLQGSNSQTIFESGSNNGYRLYMQSDGN
ncbi:MAG: hypothetical protein SGBAC_011684, partial [Bacillariaceae sp.]